MNINATLLGQMLTFSLFVLFTMKWVWPPLETMLRERRDRIAAGLAEAEKGRSILNEAEQVVSQNLAQAKAQALGIVHEAHERADAIVQEARAQAEAILLREKERAVQEVQNVYNQAKERLQHDVGSLVVQLTERLLEEDLDPHKHQALLDKWVTQWSAGSP
jgi:F-type H+-transporting ATPase subunit b